ncbi:sigma-70 family RNA polymerase sigma factor [Umezakia ovalisporum]|jgi:RNA polymerase sigma factor (sigma-70 family)|uniref:Sigma-70 family RNA polymerase sigma factor n=1 Tax=Umezakia ovalisporum FSS-43 TaxID=2740520 RepID=A0ABT6K161_9CYAN|nr:sigma-70 family RNA polymerase sigma factor [Umezakia ovalisporum]MBI1241633.1 sigma-70 family RNA polymerase sigma factor [Nostoc sp. RI_552]MDH6056101.1 sigma-70 family RNA polymerase sigma factor [Umezakia ovalisporum FSS-43]MDH6068286.1 sigma-70 family RNA polymerase sigma factor [Umezakia ovalisporum APH033B]MDH6069859.1 sigma-70 family RNA polymerase sigma factor [Umezakia ovalisporum CobakiLakeA]MDH6073697.1 sigma-70 family RNA polymerase sigma factor [Umezakia ovalisporum CS-1034]
MQSRQSIIEIFSTFVQFDGDRFGYWATERKLRRSIQSCLQQTLKDTTENFWVLYWYKFFQVSETKFLAQQHLTAYLQEPCYWISQRTAANLVSNQYKLSDCFQIAIGEVDQVLQGFNPGYSSSLKSYASIVFSNVIRETLRQMREVDICTNWGLLRKTSQKRLHESLRNAGLSSETISAYIWAWQCFKTLYVPRKVGNSRQLSAPDEQIWQVMAQAYNAQTSQKVNPQTLETWLINSAKAVRRYLYPTVGSLNISPDSDDSRELVNGLPGTEQESLIAEIVAQEEAQTRNFQQVEVKQVLETAIHQLEPQGQKILQLYYSQQLNQDTIARQMEIKQYTVSRRLTKAKEILLRSLAKWSQDSLHISVTTDVLISMSAVIEEWLHDYYRVFPN